LSSEAKKFDFFTPNVYNLSNLKRGPRVFSFRKDNKGEGVFFSPADGEVILLESVPDEVFSKKMLGDGVAIDVKGDEVFSPCDAVVEQIFETMHAYTLRMENGINILIHIGIDTVELKGEGFESFVKNGQKIDAGWKIAAFNRELIANKGYSLITPVIITECNGFKFNFKFGESFAGKTIISEYTKM
jgi:glucose-specific phosphotransferase system IIA component